MSGDEDVPCLHFKKHYRFNFPFVPDNTDSLRHMIRVTGISNVAVFGGDGVCVHNDGWMGRDIKDFMKVIDTALAKCKVKKRPKSAYDECGTLYPPGVKKQGRIVHEWMPALCTGADGRMHLVYVTDKEGTNDILLMSADAKGKWGKPVEIAATDADEYAPAVVAGKDGKVIVAYTANTKKGRYEIFTVIVDTGKIGKPRRVTNSPDDAMAPRLCFDGRSAWLTWYEWRKMGDKSRDREIFVAKGSGSKWSKATQVSPKNVPTHEDHSDPVICPDGKGGVWVAWAWDYHNSLASRPPVDENSIFVSHVDRGMKVGKPLAAGFRGEGRARDYAPTIALTPDGVPWTAWDNNHKASTNYGHKAIFVNRLTKDDFGDQFEACANRGPICSPRLVVDPEGGVQLVWAQWNGKWELRACGLTKEGPVKSRVLKVKARTPRYPTATYDAKGNLWVAYSETEGRKWRVSVQKVK